MDYLILAMQILILLILIIGGFFLKNYLPSYFSEKGKNLATREDIATITEEIERIRVQYTSETERLKASLSYSTGERTRLREQQREALLSFYKACSVLMDLEAEIYPTITSNLEELSEKLTTLSKAGRQVMGEFIHLGLYMPLNHKLYKIAAELADKASDLPTDIRKHLTPLIDSLSTSKQTNKPFDPRLIAEYNVVTERSVEVLHETFSGFVIEFNKYFANPEIKDQPPAPLTHPHN